MADTDVWLTPEIRYSTLFGSIMLNAPSLMASGTLVVSGEDFTVKHEFHCTLINARKTAEARPELGPDGEQKIVEAMRRALATRPIVFSKFLPSFSLCTKDTRKTIIVGCEVQNIESLFDELRSDLKLSDLPNPFPHVTLYTIDSAHGIAVRNAGDFAQYCQPLNKEIARDLQERLAI